MCWTSMNKPIKMVAEEDIPVKKVLLKSGDRYLSPIHRTCEWKIGETRENELDTYLAEANERYFEICLEYKIEEGLHSMKECEYLHREGFPRSYWKCQGNPIMVATLGECICDFIIPKGAEYYVNTSGLYVSNKLKFIGETKLS